MPHNNIYTTHIEENQIKEACKIWGFGLGKEKKSTMELRRPINEQKEEQ